MGGRIKKTTHLLVWKTSNSVGITVHEYYTHLGTPIWTMPCAGHPKEPLLKGKAQCSWPPHSITCLVNEKNDIFSSKNSWCELVSTRRSTVQNLPLPLEYPGQPNGGAMTISITTLSIMTHHNWLNCWEPKNSDTHLRVSLCSVSSYWARDTKGGSITVLLTSCLTGLESAVWQLTIVVFISKTD